MKNIERKLTYLASPYSHPLYLIRLERFKNACIAAGFLMRKGHLVFSPISRSHPILEYAKVPGQWEFWKKFDIAFLECSKELVVLTLDGWEASTGVTAEISIATAQNIPISYLDFDSIG